MFCAVVVVLAGVLACGVDVLAGVLDGVLKLVVPGVLPGGLFDRLQCHKQNKFACTFLDKLDNAASVHALQLY